MERAKHSDKEFLLMTKMHLKEEKREEKGRVLQMSCFCNIKANPGATWKIERSSCPMCVFTLGSEMAAEPEAQTRLFPSLTNKNQASVSLHVYVLYRITADSHS